MKVVIFEPLFLVAIGGPQPNAAALVANEGDGTQPLVSLRRLDPLFDRSYSFTPDL